MAAFWIWPSFKEWETMNRYGFRGSDERARSMSMNRVNMSFSVRELKKIAKQTQFFDVQEAAQFKLYQLKKLPFWKRKAQAKEYQRQKEEKERKAQQQKEQFDRAAEDKSRPEYWLKKLYEHYAQENSYGRDQIEQGLLTFGDSMYPLVRQYVFTLAKQYQDFTSTIKSISYGTDQGRSIGATIDVYSEGLGYAVRFLAKFSHPDRVKDIAAFYQYVKQNVYSHSEGGFSDMFNAVKIRENAVRAMAKASQDHGQTSAFYGEVLRDPCRFVRWVGIDTLQEQWTPQQIKGDQTLYQALLWAYGNEDNGTSNRREKCKHLLGKE